ncbi:MAG TPA: hypothetical protein VN851_11035 [Thermoanaerobaculia bacterium]|nr:hypothetical protein [Thermoanaerobaculia bacterium]
MNHDREHLRLLSIFHYVVAGFAAMFACLPLVHLAIGLAFLSGKIEGTQGPDDGGRLVGGVLVALASVFLLLGWTLVALLVLAGRSLARHRRYTFCLVMAAISCAFMPFGTVLGVFTLIVLLRPGVKELFGVGVAPLEGL